MLDYDNLVNIEKVDKHNIYFKDGRKVHSDNFTFEPFITNQQTLENFDKTVKFMFFTEPIQRQDNIIYIDFNNISKNKIRK